MGELLFKDETYQILGACFEVYKTMGCGFLEEVYQESLEVEFALRKVPFVEKKQIDLSYKGRLLQKKYIPDFLCYDSVVVEIKAVSKLIDEHKAQLLNYLHATRRPVGLLINFGHYPKVEHVRYVV